MYQAIAINHADPNARLKLAAFVSKEDAKQYAVIFSGSPVEVVDEKTGLLKGIAEKGAWTEQLKPACRPIV